MSYRIRLEGELLVLQVYVPPKVNHYTNSEGPWRDATIGDIPIADPFARPAPPPTIDETLRNWNGLC